MGVVNAEVTVSNPADRSRSWRGSFMVDTGATDSLVPRRHLEVIGIEPESRRAYVLANGDKVDIDVAVARIELMGEMVGGTVFFGDDDAKPLLGVTALESLGIEVETIGKMQSSIRPKRIALRRHDDV